MEQHNKPQYGTWIRQKKIAVFWSLTLACCCLSLLAGFHLAFLAMLVPGLLFGYIALIITLTQYQFSASGGNFQNRIHALILERIPAAGPILDIGCGNGNLIMQAAHRHPQSALVGIDFWGEDWEYSKQQCERNAVLEGLPNVRFEQGTASKLAFEDAHFDVVMSCLTFHEVTGLPDKTPCLQEALRVLKKDGKFILFDLFDDPHYYPDPQKILATITTNGGVIATNCLLSALIPLPFPLNTPKVLRYGRLIVGSKMGGA